MLAANLLADSQTLHRVKQQLEMQLMHGTRLGCMLASLAGSMAWIPLIVVSTSLTASRKEGFTRSLQVEGSMRSPSSLLEQPPWSTMLEVHNYLMVSEMNVHSLLLADWKA